MTSPALGPLHGLAHQVGNDGALVLASEGLVEGPLHFLRDAEIYGAHGVPLVELLNISTTLLRARRRVSNGTGGYSATRLSRTT